MQEKDTLTVVIKHTRRPENCEKIDVNEWEHEIERMSHTKYSSRPELEMQPFFDGQHLWVQVLVGNPQDPRVPWNLKDLGQWLEAGNWWTVVVEVWVHDPTDNNSYSSVPVEPRKLMECSATSLLRNQDTVTAMSSAVILD